MRRLLLAFMIALVPLRALVGDAMAMSMVAAPAHGASQVEAAVGFMPCPDHVAVAADPRGPSDHHAMSGEAAESQAHAHDSCDLCNGPAMEHIQSQAPSGRSEHGIKTEAVEPFLSSEPQRGIKPPIS